MEKLIFTIFIALVPALFAYTPGSKCGLTDQVDDSWTYGRYLELGPDSPVKISSLPTRTKQQLIVTAKDYINGGGDYAEINSSKDAVNYLRKSSEGGDLYVSDFSYQGHSYTQVYSYPGGNQYGLIFKRDSLNVVAENADGSIECR